MHSGMEDLMPLQLKLGLNPLTAAGLVDGPYLESLLHLDLRGGRFTELPQVLTRTPAGPGAAVRRLVCGKRAGALLRDMGATTTQLPWLLWSPTCAAPDTGEQAPVPGPCLLPRPGARQVGHRPRSALVVAYARCRAVPQRCIGSVACAV